MLRCLSQYLFVVLLCVSAVPVQATESIKAHLQHLLTAGAAGQLPATETLDWSALQTLYERADGQLLWSTEQGVARQLMQQDMARWVNASLQHGLNPADYQSARLQSLLEGAAMSPEPVLNDLLLSHSFMRLARDLAGVAPVATEHDRLWRFPVRSLDAAGLLLEVAGSGDVDTVLQSLLPDTAEYQRLVASYADLLQQRNTEGVWIAPDLSMTGLLRPGDDHAVVPRLRELLIRKALLNAAESSFEAERIYTPLVVMAVKTFQQQQGLESDGILGPVTRDALQRSPTQRLQQLRANLQRWRWLPRDLGERYLLVRTGSYSMALVEQKHVTREYKIISGRPRRPTLSFQSDVDHLILHPSWTVPFKLAVEDLLPKQRQDEAYLTQHNIEVLQRVEGQWQAVAPQSVDWQTLSRRNFPYLLRQQPGPWNSLGQIRFGMSNPYSIYLHDTPQQSLFESSERAFSSGCIRVSEINDLAQRLLGERSLQQALNVAGTRTLRLERPLPVYLVYLTAWVDEQQQIHYHPDVYDLDKPLVQALGPLPDLSLSQSAPWELAQKMPEE